MNESQILKQHQISKLTQVTKEHQIVKEPKISIKTQIKNEHQILKETQNFYRIQYYK